MIRRSLSKCLGLSLSIGLIFGSTGCSTLQIATGLGLKQPEVSLSALSVKDVSLTSMRIVARLNISNPNRFGVEVAGYSYSLEVGEWPVVDGRIDESFLSPRMGEPPLKYRWSLGLGTPLGPGWISWRAVGSVIP